MSAPQLPRVIIDDEYYWLRDPLDADGSCAGSREWKIGRAVVKGTRGFDLENSGRVYFILTGWEVEDPADVFEIGPKVEGKPEE
jgi:hypothetical protein